MKRYAVGIAGVNDSIWSKRAKSGKMLIYREFDCVRCCGLWMAVAISRSLCRRNAAHIVAVVFEVPIIFVNNKVEEVS